MKSLTLFVPAFDAAEARIVAESIARGETSQLEFHTNRAEVDRICAHLNRDRSGQLYESFEVSVGRTTTQDGRLFVGRIVSGAGEFAAAITLFAILPALAARFWGVLA